MKLKMIKKLVIILWWIQISKNENSYCKGPNRPGRGGMQGVKIEFGIYTNT